MTTTEARAALTTNHPNRTICVQEQAWRNPLPCGLPTSERVDYQITIFEPKNEQCDEKIEFQETGDDLPALLQKALQFLTSQPATTEKLGAITATEMAEIDRHLEAINPTPATPNNE